MVYERYECFFYQGKNGESPVENFIDSLSIKSKEKFIFKKELLESFGSKLRYPHTDSIGNGIYELRFKSLEGQIRLLFFFYYKKQIILFLHGFIKKSQKTPAKETRIATQRMKEFLKGKMENYYEKS